MILATGHSARGLYESLYKQGVTMTPRRLRLGRDASIRKN